MKKLRYWSFSLAVDAIFIATFYYWQIEGIEKAGNIFIVLAWASIIMSMMASLARKEQMLKQIEENPRPCGFGTYQAVSTFFFVCLFAWAGMFWTAGFYLFSALMYEAARNQAKKIIL